MIKRSRVRVLTGAAGDIFFSGSTFCTESYFAQSPGEIKRREVELDPQVSPEEIMSRKVELGYESWTFLLVTLPSTADETAIA